MAHQEELIFNRYFYAKALLVSFVLVSWYLRDFVGATLLFPWNHHLFALCFVLLFPTILLRKKWRMVLVIAMLAGSLFFAPVANPTILSPELFRRHYIEISIILSTFDVFVAINIFILLVESKPRAITLPLATVAGFVVFCMIYYAYHW
jgi:hypothetical protein